MTRFIRYSLALVVLIGAGLAFYPRLTERYDGDAARLAERAQEMATANAVPLGLAVGTFLLTVVYHAARGKTLRESVEVAATRVTLVPVPADDTEVGVVRRAKARATRAQLIADQIGLQTRLRKVPDELTRAEKEACYAEQAVADARRVLADREKAQNDVTEKVAALRAESKAGREELAAIDAELKKLAEVV
jgi:hypothetical protein